jgi:ribonuclease P protein component
MPRDPALDQRLTPQERLTHPRHIEAVFACKRSDAGKRLVLYAMPNSFPFNRLAVVIGRKAGNAVVRHRFKRIVREAFRLSKSAQPTGWDWIVLPRLPGKNNKGASPPKIVDWTMTEIQEEMILLMQRQAARESRRDRPGADRFPSKEVGHVPTPPPPGS